MSHIARIGRRSWRVRGGMAALYAVLTVGAITTVYPFLLMISTATKSQVDFNDYSPSGIVPAYLRDDALLFTKYAEDRYANNIDDISASYNREIDKTANVLPPVGADTPGKHALAADWQAFAATLPAAYQKAGFGEHDSAPSPLLIRYRAHLRDTFGDINALNKAWTEEDTSFDTATPPFERTGLRE